MTASTLDPRQLIAEAYRIEGITEGECRSIFLDWVLGLPVETPAQQAIPVMLHEYGEGHPDHPMTATLRAGLADADAPRRRGGRAARLS